MVPWARAAAVVALTASGVVACGEATDPTPDSAKPVEPANPGHPFDPPPAMRLHYGDESIALRPWTYCYVTTCADGVPPNNLPDIGSPEQLVVEFPVEGWRLSADFEAAGVRCSRIFSTQLDEIQPGRFLLTPAGYADEYDVTLTGRGPGGDAFTSFRWATPYDGPLPSPSAHLGIVTRIDGTVDSYGVEMWVEQLRSPLDQVDATITVTAADGESMTFAPRLSDGCRADGDLSWDSPKAQGKEAAKLGPPPLTYDVSLVLNGQTHHASATWPDDVFDSFHGYVPLDFSPALPALN
jgi:hypothetical protein